MGLVLAALPTFLVGGLAVQIRDELVFSEAALGAAVTGGFLIGAIAAPLVGTLADRLGPRTTITIGSILSIASLAGIAGLASSWAVLATLLGVAGLGMAFTDPGLAVLVTRSVPHRRHGFAFGIKEASIPIATLLAGLAVPVIALTVGWRWAFTMGLVPMAVLVLLLPRLRVGDPPAVTGPSAVDGAGLTPTPPRRALVLVALAAALGSAASSGVGVFLTESGVAMGLTPSAAGLLLATGSVAGIITRIGTGIHADRDGGEQLRLISWMLVGGSVTMALASIGPTPLLVIGAIGAFAGGWGWTGLLFLSLVRAGPSSPGALAGIGASGLGVGNALGPLAFGVLAQTISFRAAWMVAAVAASGGAILIRLARRGFMNNDSMS